MTYSLALGPFGAPWHGPQRIVLKVTGERVGDLEYRDGLNERDCATRLTQLDLPLAVFLAHKIDGAAAVAHGLAFCQALEQLANVAITPRAGLLRCIAAELERASSHLHAVTLLLDALGLMRQASALASASTAIRDLFAAWTGARVAAVIICPGGVETELSPEVRARLLAELPQLGATLYATANRLIGNRALFNRVVDIGALSRSAAEQFGLRGPIARAAGIPRDTRIDEPYAGYGLLRVNAVTQESGDVFARMVVLLLEALESLKQVEQAARELPDGAYRVDFPAKLPRGSASAAVESPQGLLRYNLSADGQRLTGVEIDRPRQLDRLLARTLLVGALAENVPAIVLSCDPHPAGAEL